ncbi:MAG: hypothetical protein H6809_00425 [Phycisphaeraceae bacterium]|nr:hypothetical protein [Phycisphaeraceae bacterium]
MAFRTVSAAGFDGLYLWDGGVITKVLREGDTLDGATVVSLRTDGVNDHFDGQRLVFAAGLDDGRRGVYFASVPSPAVGPVLVLAITRFLRRSR